MLILLCQNILKWQCEHSPWSCCCCCCASSWMRLNSERTRLSKWLWEMSSPFGASSLKWLIIVSAIRTLSGSWYFSKFNIGLTVGFKGQLISEWLFDVLNFHKTNGLKTGEFFLENAQEWKKCWFKYNLTPLWYA